ncbi:hypothetical protein KKA33_03065 [Patescibacteria group bacterium]|nr:hypothetical protein [Patescibacteria group bacterium]
MQNISQFHQSTSDELNAIKDKVRSLIGSANWGEEGRYKEAILKNVIRKFLPKKFALGTGFVVKRKSTNDPHEISKQIDIIIYDTAYPLLFSEGDFIIIGAEAVNGIIEVKTNLKNQTPENVIKKSNEMGKFVFQAKANRGSTKPFFNGIFSYEGFTKANASSLKSSLSRSISDFTKEDIYVHLYCVNHVSLNDDLFIRLDKNETPSKYKLYELKKLSFSFFVSNLIYLVTKEYIEHEKALWFPSDKKLHELQ